MPTSATPTFLGRSGPTKPLSHQRMLDLCYAYRRLWEAYRATAPLTDDLTHDYLEIQAEMLRWEQRSAKLRYEARRQATYRANQRGITDAHEAGLAYDASADVFVGQAEGDADDLIAPTSLIPDSTKAALAAWRAKRGDTAQPLATGEAPDTSGYKQSGLV